LSSLSTEPAELRPPVAETKAQKVERLKREKNPWAALDEIKAFARQGRESVLPEWATTYFKWWGIYTQGDGAGATGGKGGEGKTTPFFMLRIALPNGLVRSNQLHTIANLAERYGRSVADITVRQNIQLHWLTIESIPDVMEALGAVGLSPKGACGDVVRNVTGCPLAGVAADEIYDASALSLEVAHLLTGNSDFYNLPRKFKIAITGCPVWCSYPEINDIGLTAVERFTEGKKEIGFSLRVGGGLSADPHLAVHLDAFVRPEQVVRTVRAITEIFRDQDSLRQSRERARLKHLFTQQGWTAESFLTALKARLGFALEPAAPEAAPSDVNRDHSGIEHQKQPGLYSVGAAVLRGRITAQQIRTVVNLADRFANGLLRTTNMQNLIVINVPAANTQTLADGLNCAGLRVNASPFWRGAIACTGSEFCKLAVTETKSFTRWLVEELEVRVPGFDQQLKLHVAGCPNSCGQHWIADIGLEGKKIKVGDKLIDAYYFCLGGAVGQHQSIARLSGYRCVAPEVPAAIERLLKTYISRRNGTENLRAYFSRHSDVELRAQLAGQEIVAVGRDLSPGPVPHGAGE
jgi:sulfite reductase (ferredoxin)